ncbi:MAG: hypothetical protein HY554_02380, partial [Elusimicrobia bacterium]|nr:hypothetical protein [Elusimicrobiota bacterium]
MPAEKDAPPEELLPVPESPPTKKRPAAKKGAAGEAKAPRVYARPLSHSSISMYLECPQKFK